MGILAQDCIVLYIVPDCIIPYFLIISILIQEAGSSAVTAADVASRAAAADEDKELPIDKFIRKSWLVFMLCKVCFGLRKYAFEGK